MIITYVKAVSYRSVHPARNLCRAYITPTSSRRQTDERLRILFCGSDEFSAFSLKALAEYAQSPDNDIESIDVVTRKDKRGGRGLKSVRSPFIKSLAERLQLPLHQIDTFTGWTPPTDGRNGQSPTPINLVIAVSFGLLVPPRILRGATYGGLNVHPSLLPQFKGAAPIQWSILNGLNKTGVSLQTLHASKFDEGVVLDRIPVPVWDPSTCTFDQLRDQLGPVGAKLLVKCLQDKQYLFQDSPMNEPDSEHTSYAPKIKKQHSAIDPQLHGAGQIRRMQRALKSLWAHAQDLDGKTVRVLTCSFTGAESALQKHLAVVPEALRTAATSVPIGVPYGIVDGGRQPIQAGKTPLFMNTITGPVAIECLTVGGAPHGSALASSAKGRLLEHHAHLEIASGEVYDIYKFCAPLWGEPDGLPAMALGND